MILYRLISWPYFRKHLMRTGLTVTGIILGVAVFVGMHSANQAVLAAFYKTADRIAGATQLQVTAGDSGFAEEVLERVQAVPGVRVAAPVIEAVVNTGLPGQGNVMILAVDFTGDRSLRDYDLESGDDAIVEDPLVFLAQPDSLIVTEEFATRNNLRNNSRIPMQTMDGPKQFTVRGIMKSGGLTTAFGGNLAIMDVYAAQAVFGRGRRFDRIDLAVSEGFRIEDVQSSLRQALGDGFEVQPPASRGQQFEAISVMYSVTANISSVFALLVGLFIIYNTFAIAVTQRRSEIGILRALGATRGQIRTLFLGEGAITGLIGSGFGVLLGIVISRGIAGSLAGFLETVYGVANRVEEVATNPRLVSLALAMGVATSLIAALVPARNAAQVDPVQALQKGKYQLLTAGENRRRRIAGTICFLLSLAALAASRIHFFFYLGYLLSVIAALLFAPTFSLHLSRLLRPVLRKLRPVEGTLAADSLIQSPRRTSGAVSALMLSLSLVIAIGGLARASYNSIVEWMDTTLDPDLFVGPTDQVTDRSFLFPPSIGDEIERMDGVERVQRVRSIRLPFRGGPILVVAVEVGRLSDPAKRRVLGGDPDSIYRRAAAGEGVIVSENLALLHDLNAGETIEIPAPSGILRLPILGIAEDYSDQKGTVMMDRSLYLRHWNDDRVNLFRVYLNEGVDSAKVREQILARFAGERKLFVFTNERLREYVLKITGQWFGLTYIQVGVAILVAVLGIVNTMTVSISDRRREIGVLQAVGGLRNQVRSTVWIEAVAVGAIALICGCGLGAVTLFFSIVLAVPDMAGLRLPYQYPIELASVLVPLILAAAFLSSVGPAETAVRRSLVEALEYE